MSKIYLFLAEGFEETEAVSTADMLRRADLEVVTVSIGEALGVTGAHGVTLVADALLGSVSLDDASWLILPGGMPGATNLGACAPLCDLLTQQVKRGGKVAAICAAPSVLGKLNLLQGKRATCYPGFEAQLSGAQCTGNNVEVDLPFVTGNGPAAAIAFALAIVAVECGLEKAEAIRAGL